jgi:hypothetical protein
MEHAPGTIRQLRCACCDGDAGRFAQHWNRDTGFGVCSECVARQLAKGVSAQEITELYGVEGINYLARQYSRDEAISLIRAGLKARSGKPWSVKGGRGTAWGWISVDAPPARQIDGETTQAERVELATLMGLPTVHCQGISIAASCAYYREYVDRAEGRTPQEIAQPYWD